MHTVTRKDLEARAIDFNNATVQPPPSPEEPPANIGWLGSRSVSNTPILGGRTPVLLSEGGSNESNPLQDSLLDLPENKMSEKSQMTQGIIYGCLNSVLVIPVSPSQMHRSRSQCHMSTNSFDPIEHHCGPSNRLCPVLRPVHHSSKSERE